MKIDTVQFEADLNKYVEQLLPEAVKEGLVEIGFAIADEAEALVPVDTGDLRDSIYVDDQQNDVYVVAETDYAVFVHEGTSKQKAQPFLRDAARNSRDLFDDKMKEALRRG